MPLYRVIFCTEEAQKHRRSPVKRVLDSGSGETGSYPSSAISHICFFCPSHTTLLGRGFLNCKRRGFYYINIKIPYGSLTGKAELP